LFKEEFPIWRKMKKGAKGAPKWAGIAALRTANEPAKARENLMHIWRFEEIS
jgi:hypothetical protein